MMMRTMRLLLASVMLMIPVVARGQDPAPPPPVIVTVEPADQPEVRTTGLPSQLNWTFNFDAGWGTFGFANSLYNNPKERRAGEPERSVVRRLRQTRAVRASTRWPSVSESTAR